METTTVRPVAKARVLPAPKPGRERAVRISGGRGGLGRGFVLSFLLHAGLLGGLVGFSVGVGGPPPPPGRIDTLLAAEVTLEEAPPFEVTPPADPAPAAAVETLLEEIEAAPDPRLLDPASAGPAVAPDIGLPGPGPGTTPRGFRPARPSNGGGGAAPAPPAPAAAVLEAPPPAAFVPARRDPDSCPPPVYPSRERERGVEGTVRLRVSVDAAGEVTAAAVADSSGSAALDAAALEAVRGWRFHPATEGGVPVATVVLQPVSFGLVGGR